MSTNGIGTAEIAHVSSQIVNLKKTHPSQIGEEIVKVQNLIDGVIKRNSLQGMALGWALCDQLGPKMDPKASIEWQQKLIKIAKNALDEVLEEEKEDFNQEIIEREKTLSESLAKIVI